MWSLRFPGGPVVTNLLTKAADMSSIPHLRDPLEEGMPTHSSILAPGNPMDRGVYGVAKSRTQLSK